MKTREQEIAEIAKVLTALGFTVEKIEYKAAPSGLSDGHAAIEVDIKLIR
jgi:hypothetical protein